MRFKFLTGIAVIALVVGVGVAWRSTSMGGQSRDVQSREPSNIKVVVNPLPAKDGVIPIEIVQPIVVSSAPNKLDDLQNVATLDRLELKDCGRFCPARRCGISSATFLSKPLERLVT